MLKNRKSAEDQCTIQCKASALWDTCKARYHDAVDDLSCKQRCANMVAIFPQFLTSNVHFVRKGCDGHLSRNFSWVFDVQRPFRAKGLRATPQSRNFSLSFWRPTSISCERVARDTSKSDFFLSFWRPTSISCERVARDTSKSQFFLSFWRPTSISCERVARDASKSQFYLGFGRPTSISCERVAFRGAPAAPPPP